MDAEASARACLGRVNVRVALHREWASHSPFLKPNLRTSFEPHRVAIETTDGRSLLASRHIAPSRRSMSVRMAYSGVMTTMPRFWAIT